MPIPARFYAYCPCCEEKGDDAFVANLTGDALARALETDDVVELAHLPLGKGDHKWRANREEKARLRKWQS